MELLLGVLGSAELTVGFLDADMRSRCPFEFPEVWSCGSGAQLLV